MNYLGLIEAKRDGKTLSEAELRALVTACVEEKIPDYQMAALLMAIFFRGLDPTETRTLMVAMRDSGDVLTFPADPRRPIVDKHSTGGIGDKVSLPLAPLLACLGFRVPMISGRGLGITGGTLDKLESIPGFRTRLSAAEIAAQVEDLGCVICGQTESMCPADRLLYALRDVTATVPSIPLITASILSKKLAEGIEALVLDVKFGGGAFMQTLDQARALAQTMASIAIDSGVKTRAIITDMNAPTGRAAGNWLEVKEAVQCLKGNGPDDLQTLVIECAAQLLVMTQKSNGLEEARTLASNTLSSGNPLLKWNAMLQAQGTDLPAYQARLQMDHTAAIILPLKSPREGTVTGANARVLGEVIRDLGAGRVRKEASVNFDVGLDHLVRIGDFIERDAVLCRIHARTQEEAHDAAVRLASAFILSKESVQRRSPIVEVI